MKHKFKKRILLNKRLWKNKIVVLVGDFLLSKGLLLSVENEDYDILKIVKTAVKDMSEGELLQIEKARKLDIEEKKYILTLSEKKQSAINLNRLLFLWDNFNEPR